MPRGAEGPRDVTSCRDHLTPHRPRQVQQGITRSRGLSEGPLNAMSSCIAQSRTATALALALRPRPPPKVTVALTPLVSDLYYVENIAYTEVSANTLETLQDTVA